MTDAEIAEKLTDIIEHTGAYARAFQEIILPWMEANPQHPIAELFDDWLDAAGLDRRIIPVSYDSAAWITCGRCGLLRPVKPWENPLARHTCA